MYTLRAYIALILVFCIKTIHCILLVLAINAICLNFNKRKPMNSPHKVLVFAASNSRNSINKMLVLHASTRLKEKVLLNAELSTIDLNDYVMPIYSIDLERDSGIPEEAKAFYKAIGDADSLLISYAEHNGHYSVAFKNIFDWCSRIDMKIFQNKPMVIMATSPGPGGGARVLKAANESAATFGADVLGSVAIPSFYKNFDVDKGEILDAALAQELNAHLFKLKTVKG